MEEREAPAAGNAEGEFYHLQTNPFHNLDVSKQADIAEGQEELETSVHRATALRLKTLGYSV
jgi:hypothetical protein